MADPPVVSLAQSFQSQLRAADEQAILHMAKRWGSIESRLQALINDLAQEIAELQAQGVDVPQWKLYEMDRYQSLVAQVGREMAMYQQWAFTQIKDDARRSQQAAKEYAQASMFEQLGKEDAFAQIRAMWDRLRPEPTEKITALAQGGMPLHDILARAYPAAVEAMTERLLSGAALGWHPRKTAQVMMRGGLDQGLNHILLVARDQQVRNYREATRDAFRASGVIYGYKRLAAKNDRTCMACLALDGRIYPTNERMQIHPQDRCSIIPLISGRPEPKWETGLEWFRKQDPATQRKMMGTGRWNLWQERGFQLRQMVTVRDHPIWGPNALETPLKQLKQGRGGIEDGPDFQTMRNIYRGIIVEPPTRKVIDIDPKAADLMTATMKSAEKANLDPKTMAAIGAAMKQIQKGSQGMAVSDKDGKIAGALSYTLDPIDGIEITRLGFKDAESLQAALQQVAQVSLSQPSPLGIRVRVPDDLKLDYLKMGWDIQKTDPPAHTVMRIPFNDVQAFHDDPLNLGLIKAADLAEKIKVDLEDPEKAITFQTGYDLPNMPYMDNGLRPGVDKLDQDTVDQLKSTNPLGIDENPLRVDQFKHPAAGMILFDPTSGKFVITQPSKGYGGYTTTLPKGTIEAGEDPQVAAIREVWEETGMLPKIVGSLGDYTKTTSNNRFYIGVAVSGQPWTADYETTAVHLVSADQLATYMGTKADAKIAADFLKEYEQAKVLGDGDWLAGMAKLEAQKLEHAKEQKAYQENAYKQWAMAYDELEKTGDQIRLTEAALAWAKKQDPMAMDPDLEERWGDLVNILQADLTATKAVAREAAQAVAADHAKYKDLNTDYTFKGPSALDTIPMNDLKGLVEWQKTARLAPDVIADVEAIYNARLEKQRLATVLEFPPEVAAGTKAQMVAYITQQTGVAKWKINQRSKRTIEALNGQTYGDALDAAEAGAQKFYDAKNAKKQPYEAEPEPEGYKIPLDVKNATKAKIVAWMAQETGATTWKLKQMSKDDLLALDGMTKRQIVTATEQAAEKFYEAKKASKPQEDPNSPHVIAKNLDAFPGLATEWTGKQYKEIVTAYMRLGPEDLVGVDTGEIMKLAGLPQDQAQAKLNTLIEGAQLEKIVAQFHQQPFGKGGTFLANQPIHVLEALKTHPNENVAFEAGWQLAKRQTDPVPVAEEEPEGKAELLKIQDLKHEMIKQTGEADTAELASHLTLGEIKLAQKYANEALQPGLAQLYTEKILAGAGGKEAQLKQQMIDWEESWMNAPDQAKPLLLPADLDLAEYIAKNTTNTILSNQMKSHLAGKGIQVGLTGKDLLEAKALQDQALKMTSYDDFKSWVKTLDQGQLEKLADYQSEKYGQVDEPIAEALAQKYAEPDPAKGHDVELLKDQLEEIVQKYGGMPLALEKAAKAEFSIGQMEALAREYEPDSPTAQTLKGWAYDLKIAQGDEDVEWIESLAPSLTPGQQNAAWNKVDELAQSKKGADPEAWQSLSKEQLEYLADELIPNSVEQLQVAKALAFKENGGHDPLESYNQWDALYYGQDLSPQMVARVMSQGQLEAALSQAQANSMNYDAKHIEKALNLAKAPYSPDEDEDLPDWLKPGAVDGPKIEGHAYSQTQLDTATKIFQDFTETLDYDLSKHTLPDLKACLLVAKDNLTQFTAKDYPTQNQQLQVFISGLNQAFGEQAHDLYVKTVQAGVAGAYEPHEMVALIKATMTAEQLVAAKAQASDIEKTTIDHYLASYDVRLVGGQPTQLNKLEASTKFSGPLFDAWDDVKFMATVGDNLTKLSPQKLADALAYVTVHGDTKIADLEAEDKEVAYLITQALDDLGYSTPYDDDVIPRDPGLKEITAAPSGDLWPNYYKAKNAIESPKVYATVADLDPSELADALAYISNYGKIQYDHLDQYDKDMMDNITQVLQEKGYYTPYHALKDEAQVQPGVGPGSLIVGYASKNAYDNIKLKLEYGHNLSKSVGSHYMADALAYITAEGAVDPAAMDPEDIDIANKLALALQEQGYKTAYWTPKDPAEAKQPAKTYKELEGEASNWSYDAVLSAMNSGEDLTKHHAWDLADAIAYITSDGQTTVDKLSQLDLEHLEIMAQALQAQGYISPHYQAEGKAKATKETTEIVGVYGLSSYQIVSKAIDDGEDLKSWSSVTLASAVNYITNGGGNVNFDTALTAKLNTITDALAVQGKHSPFWPIKPTAPETGQAAYQKMDDVLQSLEGTSFKTTTDLEKAVADQMTVDELKLAVDHIEKMGGSIYVKQIANGALEAKNQALGSRSDISPEEAYTKATTEFVKAGGVLHANTPQGHKIMADKMTQAELEAAHKYIMDLAPDSTAAQAISGALALKGVTVKAPVDPTQPSFYHNFGLTTQEGVEPLDTKGWGYVVESWSTIKDQPQSKLTDVYSPYALASAAQYAINALGPDTLHGHTQKVLGMAGFEAANMYQAIHDGLVENGMFLKGMEILNMAGIPSKYDGQTLAKVVIAQKYEKQTKDWWDDIVIAMDPIDKMTPTQKVLAMTHLVKIKPGDMAPLQLALAKDLHDSLLKDKIYIPGMEKWDIDKDGNAPEFYDGMKVIYDKNYTANDHGLKFKAFKSFKNWEDTGENTVQALKDYYSIDEMATIMNTSILEGLAPDDMNEQGLKFHQDLYKAMVDEGVYIKGMGVWNSEAYQADLGKGTLPVYSTEGWNLINPLEDPFGYQKEIALEIIKGIYYDGDPKHLTEAMKPEELAAALLEMIENFDPVNNLYIQDIKAALESTGHLLNNPGHIPPALEPISKAKPEDLQPEGWRLTFQKLEQNKAWLAAHNGIGQPPHKITHQEQLELAKVKPDYFTKEELGYLELVTGQPVKDTGSIPLPEGTSEKGLKYMTNAQLKAHIVDHSAYTLEDLAKLKKNELVDMIGGAKPKLAQIPIFKPGDAISLDDIPDISPEAFKPPTGAIDITGAKPELVEKFVAQAKAAGIGKGVQKALGNVSQGHTVMVYTDDQGNFLGAVSWSSGIQSGALKMTGAGFVNPETTAQGVADAYQAAAKLGLPLYTWVPTTHEAQYKAWGFTHSDSQYHQLAQGVGPLSLTSAVSKNVSKQTDLGPLPLPFGASTMADAKAMTKAQVLDHIYNQVGDVTKTDLSLLSKPQLLSVIGTNDAKARLVEMVEVRKSEKELTDVWDKFQAGGLAKVATSKEAYKVLDFIDHFKPQDDPKSELTGAQWDQLISGIRLRADELAEEERNNLPYTPQFRTRPQPRIRSSQAKQVKHDGFPEDPGRLERVSGLGGSTGAELVRDPATGKQYVRKYGNNAGHAKTEAYVNNMYREMGINVPKTQLYDEGGKPYILTEYIEGGKDLNSYLRGASIDQRKKVERQIQEAFAMDALVGNWDVAGASGDNFLIDASGNLWRIDNGGSLRYRAQGGIKTREQGPIAWNEYVTEFWTMRGPGGGAKGVTGPLYDRMDWYEIMGQAEDIVKKGEALLEYVPEEERQILWARLEHMRDMVETSQVMRRDNMAAEFPDILHKHAAHLAQGGWVREGGDPKNPTVTRSLLDVLPKKLTQSHGSNAVYDEKGQAYDALKGDSGAMGLIHQYMRDNNLDINWLGEYCSSQAGSSGSGKSRIMQYWEWQMRGKPDDAFIRSGGKQAYDNECLSIGRRWASNNPGESRGMSQADIQKKGEQLLTDTILSWRAFVVTTLRNTPFKYNNQEQGFVQIVRTEADAGVKDESGRRLRPDMGTFQKSSSRGLMDSCSIYNWIQLGNKEYIGMAVPYHRIQGFYFHGRPGSTSRTSQPFYGEGENEFVADLTGLEFVYMRSGAGSFRGSTDSAWREVARQTGRSELDPSNWT